LGVLLGCGGPGDRPLAPDEVARYGRCDADADCVAVLNGCCCAMVAVHRARVEEFRANFHCEESCTCEPRTYSASCVDNACTLVVDP
jgi:hypothetical protein